MVALLTSVRYSLIGDIYCRWLQRLRRFQI